MTETNAEARTAPDKAPVFDVVSAFLAGGDPVALIRSRGARIDDRFASNGTYPFEATQIAARGSTLAVPKGTGAPATLALVMPGETTLRMTDVVSRFGEGKRLPAMPGKTWQYAFPVGGGGKLVVVLTADPANSASRVTHLTAIRGG